MKAFSFLKPFLILSIALNISACDQKRAINPDYNFTVSSKVLIADTVIQSAVFHHDRIICLFANKKVIVYDTSFKIDQKLTERFSDTKTHYLGRFHDSVFMRNDFGSFYIKDDFSLEKYVRLQYRPGFGYYDDSLYYVYGCCAGEWGASVSFYDYKSEKIFSYPASCIQQVLYHKNEYVVSTFTAHMEGWSDYFFIKNPSILYEISDTAYCNWYIHDSTLRSKSHGKDPLAGIRYYEDNFSSRTVCTFEYKGELFRIYSANGITMLDKFRNYRLLPVDTLLSRELYFSESNTDLQENVSLSAYEVSWSATDQVGNIMPWENSGLLYRIENRITFIDFITPRTPKE